MPLGATSHLRCSLLGQCIGSPLGFSSLRHMMWNRFLVKMNNYKMPFHGNEEYSFNIIIARHVLVRSHEMMAIAILTGCHVVTLSSRFREELQRVTKEPAKAVQIPGCISNTRKVQYWQVCLLNINILELKICTWRRERQHSGLIKWTKGRAKSTNITHYLAFEVL